MNGVYRHVSCPHKPVRVSALCIGPNQLLVLSMCGGLKSNIDRPKPIWTDVVTSRHCVGFFGERPKLEDLEPHEGSFSRLN